MDNKGTSIIEIIVSIALISIIVIFIFNLLSSLKNEDYMSNSRTEDSLKRTEIIHIIQNDFIYKRLVEVDSSKCGNDLCVDFFYNDGVSKRLVVSEKYLIYGDEKWTINGEFSLDKITLCNLSGGGYNLFKLIIPQSHDAASLRKLSIDLVYLTNKEIRLDNSLLIIDGNQIGGSCML